VISLLAYEAEFIGTGIEFKLPAGYLRYNVRPGADFSAATKEQVEQAQTDPKATTGWLYGRKSLEYVPEKLIDAKFFFEYEGELNTDCLIHAVNYALRYPFFVQREQVIRLMQKRLAKN
jgi:hypothetical protein